MHDKCQTKGKNDRWMGNLALAPTAPMRESGGAPEQIDSHLSQLTVGNLFFPQK